MDSQDSHYPSQSHFQDPQQRRSGGHNIMVSQPPHPNSYAMPNNTHNAAAASMIQQQQQNARFPFNSVVGSGMAPKPTSPDYCDGSASPTRASSGFAIDSIKKKRGRPRKFSPDSNIALGLSPTPVTPISSLVVHVDPGSGTGGGTAPTSAPAPAPAPAAALPSENQAKKIRGRPPGSVKKQLDSLGSAGLGFTPHVLTVKAGEDIAQKIMAFSQQGPRTVCVLSANGAICNVTLRQPATCGGTVTLEGRFEIISLSGSFLLSESNGSRSRLGGLSVSLAGADGKVVGGGVSGMLMAASPVQVVVGSFIPDAKMPKRKPSPTPTPPPPPPLDFGAPVPGGTSPTSEGMSSESDEENGGSPPHHGPTPYGNAGQGMSMYANMGWPNSTAKMHP